MLRLDAIQLGLAQPAYAAADYALAGAGFSQGFRRRSPPSKRRTARVVRRHGGRCASIWGSLRSGMSISTSFCPGISYTA